MSRPRVGTRHVVFPDDYVVPRGLRSIAWLSRRSRRLRAWWFDLSRGRLRTWVVANYFWKIIDDMGKGRFERFIPQVNVEAEVDLFGLGVYKGRSGWEEALRSFLETIPPEHFRLAEYLEADDNQVVLIARWTGTAAASGIPLDRHEVGFVQTIKQGEAARGRLYRTPEEALEAVGLRE